MSPAKPWWEEERFLQTHPAGKPGERSAPLTTVEVLSRLGVLDASRDEQQKAVAAWLLEQDSIDPLLRDLLELRGFLPATAVG